MAVTGGPGRRGHTVLGPDVQGEGLGLWPTRSSLPPPGSGPVAVAAATMVGESLASCVSLNRSSRNNAASCGPPLASPAACSSSARPARRRRGSGEGARGVSPGPWKARPAGLAPPLPQGVPQAGAPLSGLCFRLSLREEWCPPPRALCSGHMSSGSARCAERETASERWRRPVPVPLPAALMWGDGRPVPPAPPSKCSPRGLALPTKVTLISVALGWVFRAPALGRTGLA